MIDAHNHLQDVRFAGDQSAIIKAMKSVGIEASVVNGTEPADWPAVAELADQHRERIFIVGFREPTNFSWSKLKLPEPNHKLSSILHPQDGSEIAEEPFTVGAKAKVNPKYTLSDKLWSYLQAYAAKHKAKGNGFGFGLVTPDDIARTLSVRYYKDGSEILIKRGPRSNPRRLTPRECARLMGFPDNWQIPVSDTQAYRQFGNSVAVPVVKAVAKVIQPHLKKILAARSDS